MKWDRQINMAIDYIEANLENEIDLDTVAGIMCQTKLSFQRTFSLVMNMSIHEYIRKRRMTLAAVALRTGSEKIIDLSQKYGYESPEAFSRSFKEFHGVSPSAVRKNDTKLNLYPRITCQLTVKEDKQMDYALENANEQTVSREGFNWAAWPSPNLNVGDTTIAMAHIWKEAGRKCILDLGTGLGQNAVYFAKQGLNVSAIDISVYAIEYLKNWAENENLAINTEVGDMHSLPYDDHSFDCVYANHVISHSDTPGVKKIIDEIERVLKPGGDAYLSFCSKETTVYMDSHWTKLDSNTLISPTPAEKGIPHFYADYSDIRKLLSNFDITNTKHTEYCYPGDEGIGDGSDMRWKFFYVNATLQ